MCLYPKLIYNKKYTSNKKNGGVIPPVTDERTKLVPVGCGKCMECIQQKSREWQARLLEEIKHDKTGIFVTLTFSNESIQELASEIKDLTGYNLDNQIATLATRRFLERWRKKYKKSVKHWLITELGHEQTEHLHLHGIIWTTKKTEIENVWKYGYVWTGTENGTNYVNEKTVNYITKYVTKVDEQHKEYKPKILTSPGIGSQYINTLDAKGNKYKEGKTKEYFKTRTGHKISLPIYWRNKIYTDEEREKLWLEKLDKNIRYVNGQKIDISTQQGEKDYFNILDANRRKNKRLGYGDDEKNWEKIRYENQRRQIKINERRNKAR